MFIDPTSSINVYRLLPLSFGLSSLTVRILKFSFGAFSYVTGTHLNRKHSFIYLSGDHSFVQWVCRLVTAQKTHCHRFNCDKSIVRALLQMVIF